MKKLLIKLLPAVLLFCLMSVPASAQQVKIATVDLSRVFTNYWKTKQADASLQDMKTEMAKSDKEMIDGWQKAKEAYQKLLTDANNQILSSDQREKNKKAAEDKLKEMKDTENNIQTFETQAKARLQEQTLRMRDNLLAEIRTTLNAKAKTGSYTLILDSAAQTADRTPVMLYSTAEDITDALITQLNVGAPVDSSGDKDKKGDK
jgi:outer membrane protein